ncbi:hypothetical protein Drorol1_Dr00006677 [Drosera rotundifolia]
MDLDSIYVKELGVTLTKKEMVQVLVLDMMEGAIEVDWRDFFPYLRWVPNEVESNIKKLDYRREVVMKALIKEHKKQIDDKIFKEDKTLTASQLAMLVWEPIVESPDTTLVTTKWDMFEIAKDPERQDRLYQEFHSNYGSEKMAEEHWPQLPYL